MKKTAANYQLERVLALSALIVFVVSALIRSDAVHALISLFLVVIVFILSAKQILPRIFFLLLPLVAALYTTGSILGLYDTFPFFDKIIHFLASFVTALLIGMVGYNTPLGLLSKYQIYYYVVIVSIGLTIGAVWEIFEWFIDQFTLQNLSVDLDDVVTDLIADTMGVLLGGWASIKKKN